MEIHTKTQVCRKCKVAKKLPDFHKSRNHSNGYRTTCKECRKVTVDKRKKNTTCKECKQPSKNEMCNKCKIKQRKDKGLCKRCESPIDLSRSKVLCTEHLDYANEIGRVNYDPDKKREYYHKNKGSILETHRKYEKRLREEKDINYRLRKNSLVRVQDFIKHVKGDKKKYSISKNLGCTYDELQVHLECLFYDHPETGEMMTWDNYGVNGWHIDHVVPLSKFDLSNEFQFKLANNYQNLQPMWAKDNILKSNKLEKHIIWLDGTPYLVGDSK